MSNTEFRDEVWRKDRNIVFHGTKYPSPTHLRGLIDRFPKLRKACEIEISRRMGMQYRPRPTGQAETHFFLYQFIEWKTAAAERAFAEDFPFQAVEKEFSNRAKGETWLSVPDDVLFNSLDFQRDAENW